MNMLQTDNVHPFSIELDLELGLMNGATSHLVRRASDMRGHYLDAMALEKLIDEHNDPVHYEVFEIPVPNTYGHLMYCISMLHPGMVSDEFFMTKGHYHQVVNTAEIYLCLRGEGFMLMKTSEGQCHAEKMTRGRMVYVPPRWAHRSVNAGADLLTSFCVYPAEAGHNYGDIEREGFSLRVFNRDGQCVIE
jgi:glucose-6-phosphate isomerase